MSILSPMERRKRPRFARRLQVHFRKHGDDTVYSGFTANISTSGMFIGTASPLRPGSRVRVEVIDEAHGFAIEGMVAHAARVSPLLQKLKTSGMGVRFLPVSELVATLVPPSHPLRARDAAPDEPAAGDRGAAEAARKELDSAAADPAVPLAAGDTYPLRFSSLPSFLAILQRDIENGGVFVPTSKPAELHSRITIELDIPPPIDRRVRAGAVVVHVVEPVEGEDEAENLLAGMAVEFRDPERVVGRIHSLIYKT